MHKRNRLAGSGLAHVVLLAMALSFSLSGCDRFRNLTDQQHVQRAKDFQRKGNLRASEIELKNALSKNPNNAEARLLLGDIYLESGNGAAAEKELKRAQALGVAAESLKVPLAQAYLLEGKDQVLLDEIQPASETSARNMAQILVLRGNALLRLRKGKEACELYRQSNQADTQFIDAYPGLALCAVALDKDDSRARALIGQAIQLIDQQLAKRPSDFRSLKKKGQLLRMLRKGDQAREAFTKALAVRPNDIEMHLTLALLDIEAKKLDEAKEYVEKAHRIAPNDNAVVYMSALIDFRQGKYVSARDNLQKALRNYPNYLPSMVLLGAVSYSLGSYEEAVQQLSLALQRSPNNPDLRRLLVATLLRQGRASDALESLKPLLSQQPPDVQTLQLAGEAYMLARDSKTAAGYFEKAAAAGPNNPSVLTQSGLSHLASGDLNAGIADLEKASSADPVKYDSDLALISTYMSLRQYDKALAAIDVLEKKLPNAALVHNLRGNVYLAKRDALDARKSFERALGVDPAFLPAATSLAELDVQDKKMADARARFESVLAKDKNSAPAMLGLAALAQIEKNDRDYLAWVEKAAKASPNALDPKARLVEYYLQHKETERALGLARDFSFANANSAEAWDLLGRAQLVSGDQEGALTSFGKVVQLAADSPRAYYDLGVAQSSAGKAGSARAAFTKALELNADYLDARRALIGLEIQQGRGAEATTLAEAQTRRDVKSPIGPTLEGDVFVALKQFPKAMDAYERGYKLAKTSELAIKIDQVMRLVGDDKGADRRMLAWLKEQPSDAEARGYFANTLLMRNEYKLAASQFELALQSNQQDPLILNNLAECYQAIGDPRALATAEKAVRLAPDNPSVQDTIGWILLKQGQLPRALEFLAAAASHAPDIGSVRYHYAVALARSGRKEDAKKELEAVLKLGQKFPEMDDVKAMLRTL
jgi:putative PEP-CTERM system TPR-repeat lipoprotein